VTLAFLVALIGGCGSDGSQSFCTEHYDPSGTYCDPNTAKIDLETAERIARESVPEDALLFGVVGGVEGLFDPDGNAESWLLIYYVPDQSEIPDGSSRGVTVFASGDARPFDGTVSLLCVPSEPLIPLDSQDITHDAIGRWEQAGLPVRLGEEGLLRFFQSHPCDGGPSRRTGVSYGNSLVSYTWDGTFVAIEGLPEPAQPCCVREHSGVTAAHLRRR
jgi:hypothetical protein